MKKSVLLLLGTILFHSCQPSTEIQEEAELVYDHLLIFTNDLSLKESLDTLLTPAEKLTTIHSNQGTKGYYYLFFNTYLELLYLEDSLEIQSNEERFGSNYLQRWDSAGTSNPFGFGLIMKPWEPQRFAEDFHKYQSLDAPPEEFYLMGLGNENQSEPMVYVSMPQRAYEGFESLDEVDEKVEEFKRSDLKSYLQHPTSIRKLTQVKFTSPEMEGENLEWIKELSAVDSQKGNEGMVVLVFDEGVQGKEKRFPLTDHYTLVLQY